MSLHTLVRPRHSYDIDGMARIGSDIRLPELEFFRSNPSATYDIVVGIGVVGAITPRLKRGISTSATTLVYGEQLGGVFANFSIDFGNPLTVTVAPMLALSPHVVYTNIVEPLLRFVLAANGKVLLHAACVASAGVTVMLSAKTDTGKTSTVLTMLHQGSGTFYSDDMLIVDERGIASRYPKPLTISAHTLRAVPQHRLKLSQRVALVWQSRLHSRSGRAAGKRLGAANLPIMAMNAAVQFLVPPPKFRITDLVSCEIGGQVRMQNLFIIERGSPASVEPVGIDVALEELLANTEDAYGFPPYSQLAPYIVVHGETHAQLRAREREVLGSAMRGIEVTRIRVPDYTWAQRMQVLTSARQQEITEQEVRERTA